MSLLDTASLIVTPNGYKAGTLYSVIPNTTLGDLSVTRATTATRVNSSGLIESVASNVPRLDYTNGSCPSILVEPQRTNLLTYSEDLTNISWVKVDATITSNAINSPNGTITADKIVESTSNSAHFTVKSFFYTGSNTLSVFLKKGERDKIIIQLANSSSIYYAKLVDLTNGTLLTPPSPFTNIANSNIKDFGNGWFRVDITLNDIILEAAFFLYNGSSYSYTGDGTSGAYIWGAQLEAGSYATSYIPTTSASVTRNADVISKTGISSLIGQTEGTLFIEEIYDSTAMNSGGLDDTLISLTDGSSSNLISIFHYGGGVGTILFFIRLSNATQVAISSPASSSGIYKIALAYKNNDVVAYINGTQIGTDTSASIPTTSVVTFVDPVTTNSATKTVNIKSSALWKTRLTNTQLAELTTI